VESVSHRQLEFALRPHRDHHLLLEHGVATARSRTMLSREGLIGMKALVRIGTHTQPHTHTHTVTHAA
jgi:hypothetical protein